MTKCGLRTFHESSADRSNSKGRLVRIDNVEVNDRCDVDVDIVFSHTYLRWDFDDRDFDVDLLQFLAQSGKISEGVILQGEIRVDIAQTRIHCTMILAKFQDETSLTFINWVALAHF